jgi:hypothetical protein
MRLGQFRSLKGKLNDKVVFHPANTCIETVHYAMDEEFELQMTRELFLEYFNKMSFEDHANILDFAVEDDYNFNKEL